MIGKICGTGSYLPDYIIDNFKLAESVDTSDEWIQERTGIRQRHIAKKETTSYMASMAALKALENLYKRIELIGKHTMKRSWNVYYPSYR